MNIKLCNITNGGEGTSGFKQSEETKVKIGAKSKGRHIGRKLSEEHKRKINPIGRKMSDDTKRKIGDSNRGKYVGKKHTHEARLKISESQIGDKHHFYDSTIYKFIHKSGIVEICTRNYLYRKYALFSANVLKLVQGKSNSVKGWIVSKEAMPLS